LELAEESGKLKGELSAKTRELDRLNREIALKNDEISKLTQQITALKTSFEEKVYAEAQKRVHLYAPEIIREIKESFILKLSREWEITCDKCHQRFPIKLTPEEVAMLFKDGYIDVECLNSDCKDVFFIFQYPHKIRLNLQAFVKMVINEKFEEIYARYK
jgi:predicted nuclease with TOPRIM domain